MDPHFDPTLDLVIERSIDLPPGPLWACWTQPALMEQWFCPVPWKITDVTLDLRPGGQFRGVMRGPDGEEMPNVGCYLDILTERRLVWTDALSGGYRPRPAPFMTGIITFDPIPGGTLYRGMALHADAETRAKHEAMGFHDGWGIATDQLVALARTL
jgi:uncharacterized protein YndB with AHSA1/START domain